MNDRLFIGGLAWGTDDTSLRQAFEAFGEVKDVKVITDRDTGRSRGFGFVTFVDPKSAQTALDEMNDSEIDGRRVRVDFATQRNGGGGGGGGDRDRDRGDRRGGGGRRGGW